MVGGKLNGDAARTFFMRSGLQQQILGRIWVLSDNDKDGQLSSNEFNVAMKLVRMARQVCQRFLHPFIPNLHPYFTPNPHPDFTPNLHPYFTPNFCSGSATSTFNPIIKFWFFPSSKPA